jgi:hypothetical protein
MEPNGMVILKKQARTVLLNKRTHKAPAATLTAY